MHRHILIETVSPCIDGGRHATKTIVGEPCVVEADIFRDGHSHIRAVLRWQRKGDQRFEEAPMSYLENDRFRGEFPVAQSGPYLFTIEAWTDRFSTWLEGFVKKVNAERDATLDLREGIELVRQTAVRASELERGVLVEAMARLESSIDADEALEVLATEALQNLMAALDEREDAVTFEPVLKVFACRPKARFSTWYELFPRSETDDPERAATLRDAERRLPKLQAMGFDVVYLTPVHPIGLTNRKGKDDTAKALPGEPGSPWAIGSRAGGHTAIEPSLGTLDDFDHFVATARALDVEIALDFAIQCSPDHPWVEEHPDWFEHRADGSFRYAENPPFEYQDVYRVDFDTQDRVGLYTELYRVLMFWISHGVTIFRVDNPHTKPVTFWEWIISKVQASNPEVIFLAEAFTRPKMMKALAKAGFTQSYSYFTWRNEKRELEEYLIELTQTEMRHYFIPNFFTNTHDVLPEFLQKGGPAAFKLRLVLAATLSPSYGIYSGYELCENLAVPGTEEYASSEKFEIKARNYDAPGNLNDLILRLNRIRRENPALQLLANVDFMKTDDENMIVYLKSTHDRSNQVLVAVNLDPSGPHHCIAEVPPGKLGRGPGETYRVTDLLSGTEYRWGAHNYIRLDPTFLPAHILLVERSHEAQRQ
jgi:starch synthase (maltosyl-transferring)